MSDDFCDDFSVGDSSNWTYQNSAYSDGKIPLTQHGDSELRCLSCGATWPTPEDESVLVPYDHDCPGRTPTNSG